MPHGGRLKIEIGTAVVDRKFIAKYPNVRPGPHALITVTEVNGVQRSDAANGLAGDGSDASVNRPASDKPGVDLGVLLGLIGDCGGHLWMSADPPGNMVLKIHLPRPTSDRPTETPSAVTRAEKGRSRVKWFGH
jgi:hypothetical protein